MILMVATATTNRGGKRQAKQNFQVKQNFIDRDKIMHRDEFYKLPKADRRALMSHWRLTYTTETIKKEMGISATGLYRLLDRLELPTNLKAHRDSQPSILGESDKPKMEEQVDLITVGTTSEFTEDSKDQQPKQTESTTCKVSLEGEVDVYKLPELITLANKLGLALDIKNQF